MDLYVKGDNGKRADVLLNHQDVIEFIYLHKNILSKAFIVKRNTDFGTNVRTMTTVSGNCFDFTPFKVSDKILFSDVIVFVHNRSDDLFPSIQVGPFLSQSTNLAGKGLYPKLPGELEKIRSTSWLTSYTWILPLVRGANIIEGPIGENDIIDCLVKCHPAAGEWDCIQENIYLAKDVFLDSSGACPLPPTVAKVVVHQDVFLPITVLFRSIKHPSQEYTSIKHCVDQVRSVNKAAYWRTTGARDTVPRVVVAPVVAGSGLSVWSGSTETSKEREANERLAVFLGLVFVHPVLNVDGKMTSLSSAVFIDEVREVFGTVAKAAEQARTMAENMSSFAENVSKERGYLSRAARFPFLSRTLVTYLLQVHVRMGIIDGSIDSIAKSFTILTLLSPHTSHCDEYTSLINSSHNVEIECLLDQPSEKRAEVKKEVFIKGKHETIDDILYLIANLFVFTRFWTRMDINDVQSYPFVLQLLVEVTDILLSVEYRDFDGNFIGGHEFMIHTLIA